MPIKTELNQLALAWRWALKRLNHNGVMVTLSTLRAMRIGGPSVVVFGCVLLEVDSRSPAAELRGLLQPEISLKIPTNAERDALHS